MQNEEQEPKDKCSLGQQITQQKKGTKVTMEGPISDQQHPCVLLNPGKNVEPREAVMLCNNKTTLPMVL
jgi:hypothetical protein